VDYSGWVDRAVHCHPYWRLRIDVGYDCGRFDANAEAAYSMLSRLERLMSRVDGLEGRVEKCERGGG
jgi:hypothetical protein